MRPAATTRNTLSLAQLLSQSSTTIPTSNAVLELASGGDGGPPPGEAGDDAGHDSAAAHSLDAAPTEVLVDAGVDTADAAFTEPVTRGDAHSVNRDSGPGDPSTEETAPAGPQLPVEDDQPAPPPPPESTQPAPPPYRAPEADETGDVDEDTTGGWVPDTGGGDTGGGDTGGGDTGGGDTGGLVPDTGEGNTGEGNTGEGNTEGTTEGPPPGPQLVSCADWEDGMTGACDANAPATPDPAPGEPGSEPATQATPVDASLL